MESIRRYEMMTLFGGMEQYLNTSAHIVEEMWLVFGAKLEAQAEESQESSH